MNRIRQSTSRFVAREVVRGVASVFNVTGGYFRTQPADPSDDVLALRDDFRRAVGGVLDAENSTGAEEVSAP